MNFQKIVEYHYSRYPRMRPQDAVKLAYQNEFGGGHIIKDSEMSLKYLISELEVTPSNPSLPLYEPIGNRLVRVNLATLTEYRITPEELNNIFVRSAELVYGSIVSFKKKLEHLLNYTNSIKNPPFKMAELENYIYRYEELGYPLVSHSSEYKAEYAPSYRVVLLDLIKDCLNPA